MEQLLSLIGIVIIVTIIVFYVGYLKGKYDYENKPHVELYLDKVCIHDYEKTEAFGGVMDVCKKCGKIKKKLIL